MPIEYRKLVFSEEELKQALMDFCRSNGTLLPTGELTTVELVEKPDLSVRLEYESENKDLSETSLSRDQLAAALISYCSRRRIPVPRSAQKNLKIEGTRVCLFVHVPEALGEVW